MTKAIGTYGYTEEQETGRQWDMASRALDRAEAREREAVEAFIAAKAAARDDHKDCKAFADVILAEKSDKAAG